MTADNDISGFNDIDRLIHEPSRYLILAHLYSIDSADYLFLIKQTGMTWGNLSVHVSKLELAGYLSVTKEFLGKKPHTLVSITENGRKAFDNYRSLMKKTLGDLPQAKSIE